MKIPDIYYEEKYGKLYEKIENGICKTFCYKNSCGQVNHMFIKREILVEEKGGKYYDIVTPYGYGGPIIQVEKDGNKEMLVQNFNREFEQYCSENNIVSEFIRFHPILRNDVDFKKIYDVHFSRKTLGTNLKDYDNPLEVEFSKKCRKVIRQALKKGITYRVIENPVDINKFKEIYYSTMDRNVADRYYYFGEDYFLNCINDFRDKLIVVEVIFDKKVIASGLYFVYENIIHAHLSGTLNEYLNMSPAYIIKYATVLWGIENGIQYVHYGGGTDNSEENSLFKFKKKFSQNTSFDFYVGKKIWNKSIYSKLCNYYKIDEDVKYFPAYRLSIIKS